MRASLVFTALLVVSLPALAGPPPVSCTPAGGFGCDLRSDRLVFGEGLADYQIDARVVLCSGCFPGPGGSVLIDGRAEIQFEYDPALCPVTEGLTTLGFKSNIAVGAGAGGEATYIPFDPAEVFNPDVATPLRSACTGVDNLDYRFLDYTLTGGAGAKAETVSEPTTVSIHVPESVRVWEGGVPVTSFELRSFSFTQRLRFSSSELRGSASTLRLGPDGLPFRMGPRELTYDEQRFLFTTPGPAGGGPIAYEPLPPDTSAATGLAPAQIQSCSPIDPALPCGTSAIGNAGFLLDPAWIPQGTSGFRRGGLDVGLMLPAPESIVYETFYPRRMQVFLQGQADLSIAESRITGGGFDAGEVLIDVGRGPCPGDGAHRRRHTLRTSAARPQIGADGAILAAIDNLNDNQLAGMPDRIPWTFNESAVRCGTAHVPAIATDGSPIPAWYASAVPTVYGRGVYAGFNYNRTRACFDAQGNALQKLCTTDAECDTGAGESCADAGHSPLCGAPDAAIPLWFSTIESTTRLFPVNLADPAYPGREMAFVLRNSGVSGVFDSGEDPWGFGDPSSGTFEFALDRFGLAFKMNRSQWGDTITRGKLVLPWPADTDVPFEEMRVCNCGRMDGGRTPRVPFERELGYWTQTFFPYGLAFTSDNQPDCTQPQTTACGTESSSTKACIESVAPVARFAPEITAAFDVEPAGQVGKMIPYSAPRLGFDADDDPADGGTQAPWTYDLEMFTFSNWTAAGSPTKSQVKPAFGSGTADFGYVASMGDIAFPFFGLTPAGLKVEHQRAPKTNILAEAHTECDESISALCSEQSTAPYVVAQRDIAKATVALPFRLDYMSPGATTDPNDGTDVIRRGRGSFYGFAREDEFDLGSAKVASALILRPGQLVTPDADLGPAAAMRLWAATDPAERGRLETIWPAGHAAWGGAYDAAMGSLGFGPTDGFLLPAAPDLALAMLGSGAIDQLAGHPDEATVFNTEGNAPGDSPPTNGTRITGYADIEADYSRVSFIELVTNTDTEGEFYKFDGQVVTIDRHVKEGEEPITTVTQRETAGGQQSLEVSDGQSIDFPEGSNAKNGTDDDDDDSPLTFDWDFDMPGFQFRSLTGTLDLMNGGLSGMGFDKLGATMKFYADGDWYFTAGMAGTFSDYRVKGDVLTGNTTDMKPLRDIDPMVARFLKGVDRFDGIYIGGGFGGPVWNYGCPFRVSVGVDVAGWYISDSYGGKLSGWIAGTGACIVSVRGQLTLIGGKINNKFKVTGNFWVGGGIGFCSPEEWDKPSDVLDDDWCAACVGEASVTGTYPPKDFDLTLDGPDFECSL